MPDSKKKKKKKNTNNTNGDMLIHHTAASPDEHKTHSTAGAEHSSASSWFSANTIKPSPRFNITAIRERKQCVWKSQRCENISPWNHELWADFVFFPIFFCFKIHSVRKSRRCLLDTSCGFQRHVPQHWCSTEKHTVTWTYNLESYTQTWLYKSYNTKL